MIMYMFGPFSRMQNISPAKDFKTALDAQKVLLNLCFNTTSILTEIIELPENEIVRRFVPGSNHAYT